MKNAKTAIAALLTLTLLTLWSCSDDDTVVNPPPVEEPNVIDDLTSGLTDFNSFVVTWTAPEGALEYDIRFSTSAIDSTNWTSATPVDDEPVPKAEGEAEMYRLKDLEMSTEYYVAVKFGIDSATWSPLSNIVSGFTSEYDSRNKIAFVSALDGDDEIYVMDSDGSNVRKLTDNASADREPAWTGDGLGIYFSTARDGNWEIYAMDYNGASPANISNSGSYADGSPSLLYPGNRVVFNSLPASESWSHLWTMNPDGTGKVILQNYPDSMEADADWAPDGSRITFERRYPSGGSWAVYTADPDGTGAERLIDGWQPSWSPDGSKIAFRSIDGDILVMNADGTNPINLTNHASVDSEPDWSPDGSRLVFVSDRDGDTEIFIMDADGTNVTQITHNDVADESPCWSPVM